MTQEELNDINKLLENCRGLEAEIKEMNRCRSMIAIPASLAPNAPSQIFIPIKSSYER